MAEPAPLPEKCSQCGKRLSCAAKKARQPKPIGRPSMLAGKQGK